MPVTDWRADQPSQAGNSRSLSKESASSLTNELAGLAWRRTVELPFAVAACLPGVGKQNVSDITDRLNALRKVCGCALGGRFMIGGFCVTTAWLAYRDGMFSARLLWHLPLALFAAFLFAGAGKVIGIITERRRLRRELAVILENILRSPQQPAADLAEVACEMNWRN